MSIVKLQNRLDRLTAAIEARQTELADLKDRRQTLKEQLEETKRAMKDVATLPLPAHRARWLTAVTDRLYAAIVAPLARLIGARPDWW